MQVLSKDEKEHLANNLSGSYINYQKEFFAIALNKMLLPFFFIKDNALLFVRVFLATMIILILFEYIGNIYTEWELGTQAGLAAFLLMKLWFTWKIFSWVYPKGIVERAHEAANRITEIKETKAWLKPPTILRSQEMPKLQSSASEHSIPTSTSEQSKTPGI